MSDTTPQVFSGKALVGDEFSFRPVDITVEHGMITSLEENPKAPDVWICPAFFNAHTHLGDTVGMDAATSGDLVALVTPPNGLKHRLLQAASADQILGGMQHSIALMIRRGCAGCADFREGGQNGVALLKKAARDQDFRLVILGRDGGEVDADGLGVSSTRDIPDIERIVAGAKKSGKLVAFHAGERDSRDIDAALSFDPDFIVHATHATDAQLKRCRDNDIPLVICPRSNWILKVTDSPARPPVGRMLELGCRVFLGTDNVMFVQPDMPAEMAFLHTLYRIDPSEVIRMAVAGSILTREPFFIREGARAAFFILDPHESNLSFSKNPVASIVKRGFSAGFRKNVF